VIAPFYGDTATFGIEPLLLRQAIEFFGVERILFGSDTPMDDRSGETFGCPPTRIERVHAV
jgi:predicted TIM-barrel fold metal-dependent hydrolase